MHKQRTLISILTLTIFNPGSHKLNVRVMNAGPKYYIMIAMLICEIIDPFVTITFAAPAGLLTQVCLFILYQVLLISLLADLGGCCVL